jgi:hypothetical protein
VTDERKVREVWKTFAHRAVVGHALVRRVGARAWAAPAWGRVHARFFARCGVPDPFDPAVEDPGTGLGEVGLAAPRREPAPHAAPPAPKAPAGPRLPNLPGPSAPAPVPAAMERKDGKAAPRIGEMRRDDTAELKQKLQQKERLRADPARANAFKVQQPVARIPVRPGVAGAEGEAAPGTPVPVRRAPPQVPHAPPGPGVRPASAPSRPFAGAMRPSSGARPGTAPDVVGSEVGDPFAAGGPPVRPAPAAPAVAAASPEPPRAPAPPPPRPIAPPAPAQARPAPPVAPSGAPSSAGSPPPAAGAGRAPARAGGGLDDLFGMGAGGDATRIRMPKADEGAPKPRRPTVVDPSQAPGGVDRRPPPARPPSVAPSSPAPSGPTNDGPDED